MTDKPENPPAAYEITDLNGFLAEMRKVMAPVFDEQRETWAREDPAAMEAFEATGASMDRIGGNCPVQANGDVDGKRFYFRARGDEWQFHVADTDDEIFNNPLFYIERGYGTGFDAGWMPQHEAVHFIIEAIGEYRKERAK